DERAAQQATNAHRADLQRNRLSALLDGESLEQLHARLVSAQIHHKELVRSATQRTEVLDNTVAAVGRALTEAGLTAADVAALRDRMVTRECGGDTAMTVLPEPADGPDLPALLAVAARDVERTRDQAMTLLDEA